MRRTTKRTGTALRNWLGLRHVYVPALFRKKSALGLLPLLVLAIAGLFYLTGRDQAGAAWFDDGWHYRTPYNISNSGSAIASERKIKIEVDTATLISAGKMQSDCDDARFTDATGALLEYFIDTASGDCNTSSTDFYVKVPNIIAGEQSLFFYYGNPSALRDRANDFFDTSTSGTLGKGLLAYYPMNESSANTCTGGVADTCDHAFANDGSWAGNTTYTASGKMSGATTHDGSGDYINLPTDYGAPTQLSISVWFKTTGTNAAVFGQANSAPTNPPAGGYVPALFITDTGVLRGELWTGSVGSINSGGSVNNGQWHHAVLTGNSNTQSLYLDGTLVGTRAGTIDQSWWDVSTIGTGYDSGNRGGSGAGWKYFAGQIDDVRIYQRALDSGDIDLLYNAGNGAALSVPLTFTPSSTTAGSEEVGEAPISYWKFDEGAGTTANDASSSQHHATVDGAQWQTEDACISGRCLSFDGTDDYAYKTDTAVLSQTGAITLSGWIKTDTIADDPYGNNTINTIVSKWDNATDKRSYILGINYNRAGNIVFGVSHDGVGYSVRYTDEILEANTWYHITATYDGDSTYKLFINGQEHSFPNSLNVGDPGIGIDDNDVRVGVGDSVGWAGARGYFSGLIDEVKIYPYARSAAQVKADFTARGGTTGSGAQFGGGGNSSLSQGLVAYYPMEESTADTCTGGTNDTCDASGNGNDAAWNADTTPAAGKYGTALSFDGTGDYAVTADADELDTTGNWSISGWVYNSNANLNHGWQYLVMKGTGYGQQHIPYLVRVGYNQLAAGMITNYTEDSDSVSISSLTAVDTWMHFVAVFNDAENTMTIYINGQQQTVATSAQSPNANTTGVGLGATANGTGPFNGRLDEVRIYNRALSSSEATTLYSSGRGPVAHWKLDENTGTSISDVSGNQLTGSFTSSPQWTQGKFGSALQFSGSNYVSVADNANLDVQNDITIALWVKPSLLNSSAQLIMGKGVYSANTNRQYGMRLNSSNRWQGFLYSGSSVYSVEATGFTPSVGRWDHLAMVREQATGLLKMYVNGVLINTTENATGDLNDTSYAFALGREGESGSNYFTGGIDDVQIYDFALTQKQITNVMNGRSVSDVAVGSPVGHPVLHMSFDEGLGTTANDKSLQQHTGTLTNMSTPATTTSGWTVAGKLNRALRFDGQNDYVTVPNAASLNPTTGITVSAWFKTSNISGETHPPIVKKAGAASGYALEINNTDSKLRMYVYVTGVGFVASPPSAALSNNTWYHAVGVYDGSKVRLFVNGVEQQSGTAQAGTLTASSEALNIGRDPVNTSRNFNGFIDEVKIYNYGLSQKEVQLEFNRGSAAVFGSTGTESDGVTPSSAASTEYCQPGSTESCAPPVAEWKFDENTGTTVGDTSGNNNTGSFNDTPLWVPGKFGSALKFDGSNDLVNVGNMTFEDVNMSVSTWINIQSVAEPYTQIIGSWDGGGTDTAWGLGYYWASSCPVDDRSVYFQLYQSGRRKVFVTPADSFNLNQWHHISVTRYNDSGVKIYIDGKERAVSTCYNDTNLNVVPSTDATTVGARTATAGRVNGIIDQIRIFDYYRSPAQIAWEYNQGDPVAWYKFDECEGSTIYNSASSIGADNGTMMIGGSGSNASVGSCSGSAGEARADGANGVLSSSIEFDGTDDYITVGDVDYADGIRSFSYAFWIQTDSLTGSVAGDEKVVYKAGGTGQRAYQIVFSSATGCITAGVDCLGLDPFQADGATRDTDVGIPISLMSDDTWHHVVFTYSVTEDTIAAYLDGRLVDSQSLISTGGLKNTTAPLYFGGNATSNAFAGKLDDVRFYQHNLSPVQVKALYSNGVVHFN